MVVVLVRCGWYDAVFKMVTSDLEIHFEELCGGICHNLLARCG